MYANATSGLLYLFGILDRDERGRSGMQDRLLPTMGSASFTNTERQLDRPPLGGVVVVVHGDNTSRDTQLAPNRQVPNQRNKGGLAQEYCLTAPTRQPRSQGPPPPSFSPPHALRQLTHRVAAEGQRAMGRLCAVHILASQQWRGPLSL